MDAEAVRAAAGDLPSEPGVYQFEAGETVLYVGKAVDLRDRVRSYSDPRSERIARMVAKAETVDFAVTDTETQALLLEANLIKRYGPRYNVRLKDDKSYPLVQFTDGEFPRIELTRDPAEGATAFGPYTDKKRVETVIKAARETYGLRGCSDHKFENRARPCLDYEMGLCTAPCTGEIGPEAYAEDVRSVTRFFEGETGALAEPLRERMKRAAGAQNFERAANLRDRLEAVEAFHGGGGEAVSKHDTKTTDVLGVAVEGGSATVARLHAERGQLVDRERHAVSVPEGSTGPDRVAAVLAAFVPQFYAERDLPDELLVGTDPGDPDLREWLTAEGVDFGVPGAGRGAKLVELALKNARRRGAPADETAALADALGIPRPERIEGFDVSHAQGKAVVGSNVCFVGTDPEKSDYRRRQLTERNDDYANMKELLAWRAGRDDDRPDPDLLLVDGGPGQLDAAREGIGDWDVAVVALAKDGEVVHTPERAYDWPSDAPQLHLLQRVRDEAHRFAVQYHQQLRDTVETVLDELPGVGPQTRTALLRRFGSVEGVREASRAELLSVPGVGDATADTIEARL
jgi:excinuclease ABC subunit C